MHRSHFQILAAQRELQPVAALVEAFCTENDIPAAISNRMNLALDEVLSNIVKYAYDPLDHGIIDVDLTYSDNRFTATVEDAGRPFNPLQFPRQCTSGPLKERRVGELGILFVKNLTDCAVYDRSSNRNKLMMTIAVPLV
jgi:anti-sigma regulatory factor (Ser/Thr protein kinase)